MVLQTQYSLDDAASFPTVCGDLAEGFYSMHVGHNRIAGDVLRTIVQPHREGGGSLSLPHFILPQYYDVHERLA